MTESKKKRARKIVAAPILIKLKEGPIISPRPENGWEAWQTFNPGVILLDDKIHIEKLYEQTI